LLLRVFFLVSLGQLSAAAIAGASTLPPEGSLLSLGFASSSTLDGVDCITADNAIEESIQLVDNSSDLPNDLDEISLPSDDKAVIPSRDDQETPHFTTTALDPIALRQPGLVPAFLSSVHFSDSLPGHVRERAPPSLA
jgi:hypothetical protein